MMLAHNFHTTIKNSKSRIIALSAEIVRAVLLTVCGHLKGGGGSFGSFDIFDSNR